MFVFEMMEFTRRQVGQRELKGKITLYEKLPGKFLPTDFVMPEAGYLLCD